MSQDSPLSYTLTEIQSYLPSGWTLAKQSPPGLWDAQAKAWTTVVIDGVEFEWPLAVTAAEAEKKGRMKALDEAMSRVFRRRLGAHTRGLGAG
jgi:hypothetical protein